MVSLLLWRMFSAGVRHSAGFSDRVVLDGVENTIKMYNVGKKMSKQ